jgi:transposase
MQIRRRSVEKRFVIGADPGVAPRGTLAHSRGPLSSVQGRAQTRDRRSIWASRLKLARGFNVAAVALANKNARIIWALLTRGDNYRPAVSADPGNKAA